MKGLKSIVTTLVILCTLLVSCASYADDAPVSDPSGASIGTSADVIGATSGAPTKEEFDTLSQSEPLAAKVADVVGHNRIAINMMWTLLCGFLVMFMQAGFALAETGFTRAKNAAEGMGNE